MAEQKVKMIRNRRVEMNLTEMESQTLTQYCQKNNIQISDFIRRTVFKEIMTKQYEESPTLFDDIK